MGYIETSRLLDAARQLKESLESELKETNKEIQALTGRLVNEMTDAQLVEFRDELTHKRFSVVTEINVKQTDEAKLNDTEFAKIFAEHGFSIFRYTVHAQTLAAAVKKEIAVQDEFGNITLPEWAEPYVDLTTYANIKVSK